MLRVHPKTAVLFISFVLAVAALSTSHATSASPSNPDPGPPLFGTPSEHYEADVQFRSAKHKIQLSPPYDLKFDGDAFQVLTISNPDQGVFLGERLINQANGEKRKSVVVLLMNQAFEDFVADENQWNKNISSFDLENVDDITYAKCRADNAFVSWAVAVGTTDEKAFGSCLRLEKLSHPNSSKTDFVETF